MIYLNSYEQALVQNFTNSNSGSRIKIPHILSIRARKKPWLEYIDMWVKIYKENTQFWKLERLDGRWKVKHRWWSDPNRAELLALQPCSVHAYELAGLCMCSCMLRQSASRQSEQNVSLRQDAVILLKSVLPPDTDSNQTLTASCRMDVWAGATFRPQDTEQGIDGGETTVNWMKNMGKVIAKTQKEKAEQNQKELTRGLYGALGCSGRIFEIHPRGPTATLNDKLKDWTQN